MATQYTRAYRAEDAEPAGDGPISFVASSEIPARDGMAISAEGWQLDNFQRNPLVLWAHDWLGNRPPIGKAEVRVDAKARVLRATVTFDGEDPFAADIERKYRAGFLNAVSVGFDILEMNDGEGSEVGRAAKGVPTVSRAELLEISAVPIPADPHALAERQQRGMAEIAALLGKITDDREARAESEFVWPGVAALMARCLLDTSSDDAAREREHRRLSKVYRDLGRVPPEFLANASLAALEEADIRGLFGAGEAEVLGWSERKGAVLSKANLDRLRSARGLLDEAIRTHEKDAQGEGDPERGALLKLAGAPSGDRLLRRLAGV